MTTQSNSHLKFSLSIIITVGFTFFFTAVRSQDVATDNEGKAIFTVPSTKVIVPEAALKNLGISFTAFHLKRKRYYMTDAGVQHFTMYKSTTINFKANIVSNDDDLLLIGKDMNVTPHLELSINRGIDQLITPSRVNRYYTLSGAVFADLQKFDLYDTLNKKFLDKYRRVSYGGRISLNIFHRTYSAVAFNLSYLNSIVTDDLDSYQKKSSNTIYVDNNIGTNGTVDGYLSPVSPTSNWRFSVSNPYFVRNTKLAVIPYYFIKFGQGLTPKNNGGVVFTFMGDKFRNFDVLPGGAINTSKTFNFETAFSIGLNLVSTGVEKHNYIFISGTASFGSTSPKSDKTDSRTNKIL